MSETFAGTQGEASALSSYPTVNESAYFIRISTDKLRHHLRNQGYWVNPDDRLPLWIVFDALDAELENGRWWERESLEPLK